MKSPKQACTLLWFDLSGTTAPPGGCSGHCGNNNHPLFVYILILKPADPQTRMVTDNNRTHFTQKYHTFMHVLIYKSFMYI